MFNFVHHSLPELEQINSTSGRRYKTPRGDLYPSVTTILGSLPNEHLDAWIQSVGKDTANKIARAAADRGTLVHDACEKYLLGKEAKFSMFDLEARDMFIRLKPHLDKFEEIHALESRLFSDKLRVAGTVDCITKINGIFYIVDFKTSSRFKSREEIDSYFLQGACYAAMFFEQTGIPIYKIRILMTTKDDGILVFDENVKDWLGKFIKIRNSCGII